MKRLLTLCLAAALALLLTACGDAANGGGSTDASRQNGASQGSDASMDSMEFDEGFFDAPFEPAAPEEPDSLSLLREKLNKPLVPSAVQLRPGRELVVVNLMEQLVTERLDAVFEKFNCCRCDKCRHDVAALALNALPPQYVVAQPEEIPALLAAASTKEIPGALVKAILQVKSNPQH